MPNESTNAPEDSQTIKFHYIKSPHFRVIHVDGAIGGITPAKNIHISLYSERAAIPQIITQKLNPDGSLGDKVSESGKEGMVREMDVDVIVSLSAARSLRDWLDQTIHSLEEVQASSGDKQQQ